MRLIPSSRPTVSPRHLQGRAGARSLGSAGVTVCLLLGAGGASAEELGYGQILVFGDSISDSGSYVAQAPPGAGKFTTNPDPVWVEHVANGLGLPLASAAAGGLNYAEGGARVSVVRQGGPGDITRTPVSHQIDRHLASGASLKPDSLVIIQGGGNDVFSTQTNGVDFTEADLRVLDAAANDLAGQLKRLAEAGAGTIVTTSVPRFEVFNSRYRTAIAASGVNVLYVDVARLISEIEANPTLYGIVNTTTPACRGVAVQSFVCRPENYVSPDANRTYLFADSVHFTGVVHEMQGELTLAALKAPAQISQLPYVALSEAQSLSRTLSQHAAASTPQPGWTFFGRAQFGGLHLDGHQQRPELDTDAGGLVFGADYGLDEAASVGFMFSVSDGEADFGDSSSGFDMRGFGVGAFARRDFGPITGRVRAEYHQTDFDGITRTLELGPAVRYERGDTEARTFVLGIDAGAQLVRGPVRLTPNLGLRYEHVRVKAYEEVGVSSSQMGFERQTVEALTASAGLRATLDTGANWRPFVEAAYEVDLLDKDRTITVTPSGAPSAFTSAAYKPAADYLSWSAGLEADLTERATATIGAEGIAARGAYASTLGYVGLRMRF